MPAPTRPRALFFGTPEFAVPCLDALVAIADVVRVVSQPDRPSGRGLALTPTPVKARATALGIPVMQPTKVKPPELHAELRALEADVAVVVAYGRILPAGILAAPRRGCVNVHASLLPRWRGAAPIQWAVASGDRETGVCLMEMDEGLDTGPVFARAVTAIGADETAGELFVRLSHEGAALLQRELPRWLAGELRAEAQVGEPTIARLLEKRDGAIDFAWDAQRVHDVVRGMSPWPGAVCMQGDARVKVHRTRVIATEGSSGAPGTLLAVRDGALEIACARGVIALVEVQLEGKKRTPGADLASGRRLAPGASFSRVLEGAVEAT